MRLTTKLRYNLARMFSKAAGMTAVPAWVRTSFLTPTFENLTRHGYQQNGIVTACLSVLTFSFPEPPMRVWDGDGNDAKQLPTHPLRQLLRRPNPIMGEDELMQYTMAYMGLGGNAYWVAARDTRGEPAPLGLYPYHAGQVRPRPGGPSWIMGYEFYNPDGEWEDIDQDAYIVTHFKWPLPDPMQPWMAQPPLRSVSPSVDTINEIDNYVYSLLKNDAVPPTIVTLPPKAEMSPAEKARFREQWKAMFGGGNRGNVAILDDGTTVTRAALNMEELAFDALRKVPEATIAGAFRVPPIIAGLNIGLEQSTYSNYAQARLALTQDTLVPLWRAVAAEVENALGAVYKTPVFVRHDLSEVASLQEDVNERWARWSQAYTDGVATLNEYRRAIGLADQQNGDLYLVDPAKILVSSDQMIAVIDAMRQPAAPAALPPPAEPEVIEPVKRRKSTKASDEEIDRLLDAEEIEALEWAREVLK